MSISAYVGLPGSGKSYSVVELQVLPALRAGRDVVTNLPLVSSAIEELALPGTVTTFDVAQLVAEPHKILEYAKSGCIFILDEAWKLFPAGTQAVDMPEQMKSFLTEHRHMVNAKGDSTQIVLVVQDLANMAAFARRLVENTFVTTKLSFVGLSKAYRVDVFHGAVTGCTPNPKKALRQLSGRYRKEIYSLYKSHTMSEAQGLGANEQKMDGRANIFKRPAFVVGALLVPILLWYSAHTFARAFHGAAAGGAGVLEKSGAGPSDSRSGAKGTAGPASFVSVRPGLVPVIRLLLEVVDPRDSSVAIGYLATGSKVVRLSGRDCRRIDARLQCLYRGSWYDGEGLVEVGAQPPVAVWTLGGGPGGRP